jgi:hypothetical protein
MGKEEIGDEKPSPGWYDDPGSDDLLCYWDGEKFTDQFKPKPVVATSRAYGNITVFSFALGLVSLVLAVTPGYLASFLVAIPGLILGIIALARRKRPFWMSLAGLLSSALGWFISIVVSLVVAASSVNPATTSVITRAPASPNSQSAPSVVAPTPIVAPAPVVWSGDGELTTDKQELNGDYKVVLTVTQDCYYGPNLEGAGRENLPSLQAVGTVESFVYGLSGDYYIKMFTGPSPNCPWTLTFTPN